jgi:hypothetical protein
MTHTNTPIQHNIHTAYTSQQKTNLLADFYKQISTPAILHLLHIDFKFVLLSFQNIIQTTDITAPAL